MRAGEFLPPRPERPRYAKRRPAKSGRKFVRAARKQAGLQPDDHVLDLGCGIGRFAAVLAAEFMNSEGRYDGLDVSEESIGLARKYISSRDDRFRFHLIEAHNALYRSDTERRAAALRFPFEDATFDFVFSNSLFTHLLPDDTETYIQEIGRVLKPGGRTLNTMSLMDRKVHSMLESGTCAMELPAELGPKSRARNPEMLEEFVAYDEAHIRGLFDRAGLEVAKILHGSWSGREADPGAIDKKDAVVALKPAKRSRLSGAYRRTSRRLGLRPAWR